MFDIIRSFAHRGSKRTLNYVDLIDGGGPIPGYTIDLPLGDGEYLIGVYENRPGEKTESVVVTNHGLLLDSQAGWRRVGYDEIIDYDLPDKTTEQLSIPVELRSGETLEIPV